MKVQFICLLLCAAGIDALIPYVQRGCVNCWGNLVPPGTQYWDGCNQCVCNSWAPRLATCTRCYCRFNRCLKPRTAGCGGSPWPRY